MKRTNFGTALKRVAVVGMAFGLLAGGFAAMVSGASVAMGAIYGAAAWGGLLTVSAATMNGIQMAGLSQGQRRFSDRHAGASSRMLPFETLKRMHEQSLRPQQPKPEVATSAMIAQVIKSLREQFTPKVAAVAAATPVVAEELKVTIRSAKNIHLVR